MNLGLIIVLIVILGYISNWLNWRYLNYKITHVLYYIGAFVHESSHALFCLVTGAKIYEFKVFSSQPHVTHGKPKLPFIGNLLISSAPIFGGLFFLFFINHYVLGNYFALVTSSGYVNILSDSLKLITQIRLSTWQSWVMIILFLNAGAMIGPSARDIKNVWPILILLFFVQSYFLVNLGLIAMSIIFVNIVIQIVLILCLTIFTAIKNY